MNEQEEQLLKGMWIDTQVFEFVLSHTHSSHPDEFIVYNFTYCIDLFIMCIMCSEIQEIIL